MKRILIIINKAFEADAALSAIFDPDICHPDLDFGKSGPRVFDLVKDELRYPWDFNQGAGRPRAVFKTRNFQYEIWCVQNIMTPPVDNTNSMYYSYSYQKVADFPKILNYSTEPVVMVAAFGTAGCPTEVSKNGGLVIGSNAFIYDVPPPAASNPPTPSVSRYESDQFGKLLSSIVNPELFAQLNLALAPLYMRLYFELKTLLPSIDPAPNFPLVADPSIVAVSDMNIVSYAQFATADAAALKAYSNAYPPPINPPVPPANYNIPYSVETTHGLIRLQADCDNFMFISCITDRYAYFNNEVTPRASAENFACAFNGGIFLSWFLPFLDKHAALVC
jgi:hypothetical protein